MQGRILVADDAEVNRVILHDMLKEDYVIEMAEDGEQVIDKLELYEYEIVALLLDLHMPKMSGYRVISEMKKRDGESSRPHYQWRRNRGGGKAMF